MASVPGLPALPPCDDRLFAIHYSSDRQDDCPDQTPPVSAVVVQHVLTGTQQTFAACRLAEQRGLPMSQLLEHLPELEAELLGQFGAFVAARPDAVWLHWAMRSPGFGFEVLVQRARRHGLTPVEIPLERRFDLSSYLKRRFGEDYVPHPRLWHALACNDLLGPGLLNEAETAAAWSRGRYAVVLSSLACKVDATADLYDRVASGTLRTARPGADEWQQVRESAVPDADSSESATGPHLYVYLLPPKPLPRLPARGKRSGPYGYPARPITYCRPEACDSVPALTTGYYNWADAGDEDPGTEEEQFQSRWRLLLDSLSQLAQAVWELRRNGWSAPAADGPLGELLDALLPDRPILGRPHAVMAAFQGAFGLVTALEAHPALGASLAGMHEAYRLHHALKPWYWLRHFRPACHVFYVVARLEAEVERWRGCPVRTPERQQIEKRYHAALERKERIENTPHGLNLFAFHQGPQELTALCQFILDTLGAFRETDVAERLLEE